MAIYLDSAVHDEVREAMSWGFLAGVTTNPALLAAAGQVSLDALKPLCQLTPGQVFFQLTTHSLHSILLQAQAAFSVSPSQVVLMIPCTVEGLQAVARLSLEIPCAVTAVFNPAQAYLAKEAGARYVLPYVNRSTRLLGDGVALVREIARILKDDGHHLTQVLAVSIRSPAEAVAALNAGAQHVALPLEIVKQMASHPLSEQAIQQFDLISG
jgi:transaldolase